MIRNLLSNLNLAQNAYCQCYYFQMSTTPLVKLEQLKKNLKELVEGNKMERMGLAVESIVDHQPLQIANV